MPNWVRGTHYPSQVSNPCPEAREIGVRGTHTAGVSYSPAPNTHKVKICIYTEEDIRLFPKLGGHHERT